MSEISGRRTLHRLIYCSRQKIPPEGLGEAVAQIIRSSIVNNRAVSITGLLLVHEGFFVQALEGPAEMVLTTYGRISNDPRHSDAKILHAGPATRREFADWNMCARRISPADDAILGVLAERGRFAPQTLSGTSALRLLTAVRDIQRRAA